MSKIKISVSVDDAYIDQIGEVAQSLQSAGMDVEQTLSSVGVISGAIEADQLNSLSQIKGVEHVESERKYKIAPPESEIQ